MIPTHKQLLWSVLCHASSKIWERMELVAQIADDFHLSKEERTRPQGKSSRSLLEYRIGWAKMVLKPLGFIEVPKPTLVTISEKGRDFLNLYQGKINGDKDGTAALISLVNRKKIDPVMTKKENPEEVIESSSRALDEALAEKLLKNILEQSPSFFEKLIIDLLLAMGYGGSRADAGERIGQVADGGLDGVIREDQLGLDLIYLQAKRYQEGSNISSDKIQSFIGALHNKNAQKGVFITTSSFTANAREVAKKTHNLRIVLIDGKELVQYMIRFGLGVRVTRTIELRRIDTDYFPLSMKE